MILRTLAIAALLAAGLLAGAPRAAAMTFEVVNGPSACAERECVLASGDIDDRSGGDFEAFLKANRIARGGLVVFDSPGGSLLQSFRLGNDIRGAGLSTTVADYDRAAHAFRSGGTCASACVYAYLGGVERSVGSGARLGVHQVTTAGADWTMTAPDGLWLMSLVAVHVSHLCGHSDILIPALATPPQQMHWLSASELSRYSVVTPTASGAPSASGL